MRPLSVVLCDNEEMILDALALLLQAFGVSVVGVTTDPDVAVTLVRLHQPDVCVLDAHFPDASGPDIAVEMNSEAPGTAIMMLTADADATVWAAYEDRAVSGLLSKSLDGRALVAAVESLSRGERLVEGWRRIPCQPGASGGTEELTLREREVLAALVRGAATSDIASDLAISSHTVRTHVQSVLRKLNVSSRAKATQVAVARGLVGVS
jgi:two-component system nitrate/nitrite response regulator NarL